MNKNRTIKTAKADRKDLVCMKGLLTAQQAADSLGVHFTTVYNWYHDGKMQGSDAVPGRILFSAEEVEAKRRSLKAKRNGPCTMTVAEAARVLGTNRARIHGMTVSGRLASRHEDGKIFVNRAQVESLAKTPTQLTVRQVAELTGVTTPSVLYWIKTGRLKGTDKIDGKTYFERADVEDLKRQREEGVVHCGPVQGFDADRYCSTHKAAKLLGVEDCTVQSFAERGFLKTRNWPVKGRPDVTLFDKESLRGFMEFHGITDGNPENVVITRSAVPARFKRSRNYQNAIKNHIQPKIHLLTQDGYKELDEDGNVILTKTGFDANAGDTSRVPKSKTDSMGTANVASKQNGEDIDMQRLIRVADFYVQSLMEASKRKMDQGELNNAARLLQLASDNNNGVAMIKKMASQQSTMTAKA